MDAAADAGATRRLLKQKVAAIERAAAAPQKQTRRTIVTENEVNAYLTYDAAPDLPAGVVNPSVTILGTGASRAAPSSTSTRCASEQPDQHARSHELSHRPPAGHGDRRADDEQRRRPLRARIGGVGGVPVPKIVLQEIVSYYSRTPEQPGGISLDDPFALPARIREIQVQRGRR